MPTSLSETCELANHRLVSQQLIRSPVGSPQGVVRWMGAMQAQDYAMAKWAIGIRLPGSTDALIEQAINDGDIIRTHLLRPTWHFVAADDVRWMLQLTAPHVNRIAGTQYRQLELDDAVFARTNALIARMLAGGQHRTRDQIMIALQADGIESNPLRAAHILLRAELDQVVCNGARRGKQLTYALFDERVPAGWPFHRQEAAVKLTQRYFTSHGPATVPDFAWWSGLPLREIRASLDALKSVLTQETIGRHTYWFSSEQVALTNGAGSSIENLVHVLPAFDEFLIGYADRSACLPAYLAQRVILANGIFKPSIAIGGQLAGTWKRTVRKNTVELQMQLLTGRSLPEAALQAGIERYGAFMALTPQIHWL
ncbi:MAG: AlkZ family DNA glycosylase [Bacteroidetes bacterium]|nr:AlkZ family DNA glycosylase [Fibrella sp.]